MRTEAYELITLYQKLQTLENCQTLFDEWDGLGNITRAIRREVDKAESRIKEILRDKEKVNGNR